MVFLLLATNCKQDEHIPVDMAWLLYVPDTPRISLYCHGVQHSYKQPSIGKHAYSDTYIIHPLCMVHCMHAQPVCVLNSPLDIQVSYIISA